MPDWITHLGSSYLLYRPISYKDMRLALLGAILPDIFSRVAAVLEDVFHLVLPRYYQLEALHTPFALLLVAIVISLFNTNFFRCLGLVFGGSLLHLVLDMSQIKLPGFGVLLFFPLSYKTYQFNLINYQGGFYYLSLAGFLSLLIFHLRELRSNPAGFKFQRITLAIPLLAFILLMPYITWQQFYQHNVGYLGFLHYPEGFEGQEVALHFSEVISGKPLIVEEGHSRFELVTEQEFQPDDWISVRGIYRQGKIHPQQIRLEPGREKIWISLVGMLLFPLLWFDFPAWWAIFKKRGNTVSVGSEQLPNDETSI